MATLASIFGGLCVILWRLTKYSVKVILLISLATTFMWLLQNFGW